MELYQVVLVSLATSIAVVVAMNVRGIAMLLRDRRELRESKASLRALEQRAQAKALELLSRDEEPEG